MSKDVLINHIFKGKYSNGFVVTKLISNATRNTKVEGYIGYLPTHQAIYVVFKGFYQDDCWKVGQDTELNLCAYTKCPEAHAKVHTGFQNMCKAVYYDVHHEVSRLLGQFSEFSVRTTGHSVGAAIA